MNAIHCFVLFLYPGGRCCLWVHHFHTWAVVFERGQSFSYMGGCRVVVVVVAGVGWCAVVGHLFSEKMTMKDNVICHLVANLPHRWRGTYFVVRKGTVGMGCGCLPGAGHSTVTIRHPLTCHVIVVASHRPAGCWHGVPALFRWYTGISRWLSVVGSGSGVATMGGHRGWWWWWLRKKEVVVCWCVCWCHGTQNILKSFYCLLMVTWCRC